MTGLPGAGKTAILSAYQLVYPDEVVWDARTWFESCLSPRIASESLAGFAQQCLESSKVVFMESSIGCKPIERLRNSKGFKEVLVYASIPDALRSISERPEEDFMIESTFITAEADRVYRNLDRFDLILDRNDGYDVNVKRLHELRASLLQEAIAVEEFKTREKE